MKLPVHEKIKNPTHRQIIQNELFDAYHSLKLCQVFLDSNTGKEIKEEFPSVEVELKQCMRFIREFEKKILPESSKI